MQQNTAPQDYYRGVKIAGSSFCAWSVWGRISCHSRLEDVWREKIAGRWEKKASQIKKIKNRRAIKDTMDPMEETVFHAM